MAVADDIVAYKLTASRGGVAELTQYVSPDNKRYATKLLWEEGYEDVAEEALTELPEGVELDVE
jgi:hypothetical protein